MDRPKVYLLKNFLGLGLSELIDLQIDATTERRLAFQEGDENRRISFENKLNVIAAAINDFHLRESYERWKQERGEDN